MVKKILGLTLMLLGLVGQALSVVLLSPLLAASVLIVLGGGIITLWADENVPR